MRTRRVTIITGDPGPTTGGLRIDPFTFGLVGALGVLVALLIGTIIGQLSTVLVYIGIALFLALGLDPVVRLIERKLPRGAAVAIVVVVVVLAFAGILLAIVPIVVGQIAHLVETGPKMIDDMLHSSWYKQLAAQYGDSFSQAVNGVATFFKDPGNLTKIGGGLLVVGAGIAGGFTGVTIVLILTLYFMASLRGMKRVAARFVPAYRRPRFSEIVEDVSGAVGRYVIGQASLALINGVLSLIFLSIIGAPLPALLALIAFIGSLIPLVGTLSGSIINSLICLFVSPVTALIAFGVLPRLHADRGIRHQPAHHEQGRRRPRGARRDRGRGWRCARRHPRRARRDPRRRERDHHHPESGLSRAGREAHPAGGRPRRVSAPRRRSIGRGSRRAGR